MEQSANLDDDSSLQSAALVRGVIHRLKHLSAGTDIRSTHLVSAHNGVGYRYIRTPEGDVFFDASAVTNVRFDRLTRDMTVEFLLDDAPYLRTSKVTVIPMPEESNRFAAPAGPTHRAEQPRNAVAVAL